MLAGAVSLRSVSRVAVIAGVAVFMSACGYMDGYTYRPVSGRVLRDDRFVVTVQRDADTRAWATDFFLLVAVKNISSQDQLFDSGDVELRDPTTGMTYFSVSKDKELVRRTHPDLITRVTLKPGQQMEGVIHISTPEGKAGAERFEVRMGSQMLVFAR